MKIEYKSAVVRDIAQKKEYIETILKNKKAAQKLAASILRAVSLLASNPRMGAPLQGNMTWKPTFASSLSPDSLCSIES